MTLPHHLSLSLFSSHSLPQPPNPLPENSFKTVEVYLQDDGLYLSL